MVDVVRTQLLVKALALLLGACLPAAPPHSGSSRAKATAAPSGPSAPVGAEATSTDSPTTSIGDARLNLREALEACCRTCLGLSRDCQLSALLTLSPAGSGSLDEIERPRVEPADLACIRQQLSGLLASRIESRTKQVRAEFRSEPESDCIRRRAEAAARCDPTDLMCQMRAYRAPIKDARALSRWHESESCDYAFALLD